MSPKNPNERRNGEEQGQRGRGNPSPGVIGGAAFVGAGVGALIGGPFIAIGLGATAAGLCLSDNKAGDVARSTGRAGLAVINKGKALNERYGFGEKVKDAAHTTYEKAKEVDAEHGVVDKAKAGASQVDREHRLSERAGEAIGKTMESVADALSEEDKPEGKESKLKVKK